MSMLMQLILSLMCFPMVVKNVTPCWWPHMTVSLTSDLLSELGTVSKIFFGIRYFPCQLSVSHIQNATWECAASFFQKIISQKYRYSKMPWSLSVFSIRYKISLSVIPKYWNTDPKYRSPSSASYLLSRLCLTLNRHQSYLYRCQCQLLWVILTCI